MNMTYGETMLNFSKYFLSRDKKTITITKTHNFCVAGK